jgi:hypothetical protein
VSARWRCSAAGDVVACLPLCHVAQAAEAKAATLPAPAGRAPRSRRPTRPAAWGCATWATPAS